MAERTGPTSAPIAVAALTRRLAEAPLELVEGSSSGRAIVVAAVLSDVLEQHGHEPLSEEWLTALDPGKTGGDPHHRSWQKACGLIAWLMADPDLGPQVPTRTLQVLLGEPLRALTAHVEVRAMVADDDRREEVVRLLLREAGITPDGETPAQAADRLSTLDTATRLRVIEEARGAEEHARQVREALARKRAQEAAAKAMRE